MQNIVYSILKENTGYVITDQLMKIFCEQNLENYILSKDFDFKLSENDITNRLIKGQIDYEILKVEAVLIAEKFDAVGINYRFLKGLGISMTYPLPYTRIMNDFDILVIPEMFDMAINALIDIGYHQEYKDSLAKDITFFKVGAPYIELHREIYENQNLDYSKDYGDLIDLLWKDESKIEINNYYIKVPLPEEHIKYIMIHFFKHFKSNGCGARFLLDILYFCQFHKIEMNELMKYFNTGMMFKFNKLIDNMLLYYFGYGIIKENVSDYDISQVLIAGDFLLLDGTFGKSNGASEQTNRFNNYKRAFFRSPLDLVKTALFPPITTLDYRFEYAKRNSILLPIAWIHRIIGFVFGKRPIEQKLFFLSKNKDLLKNKELILKQLGYY